MSQTDAERLQIFIAGWGAMKWLAAHAKAPCGGCSAYRKRVAAGSAPDRELHRRCHAAREMRARYRAVEKMLAAPDEFHCDAQDPDRPDITCAGAVELALAERSRRNGRLISYLIGCAVHVRHQEAKAIIAGSTDTFVIEPLEKVVQENAAALRPGAS